MMQSKPAKACDHHDSVAEQHYSLDRSGRVMLFFGARHGQAGHRRQGSSMHQFHENTEA